MTTLVLICAVLQAQDPKQEELQEQIESLEKRLADLEKKQAQTVSANPQTVLNPTVTVIGNSLWRLDNKDVFLDDDPTADEIDDTFNFREAEVDFRAAIDPYADGVFILALESEVVGAYEAAIEEFYINVKSLPFPFWENPPLGTRIKFGRFRTEFGRNNRLHLHDLPQPNRPLVIEDYLGEEGDVANGGSATCFLPSPGDTVLELTAQALQGGSIEIAQDAGFPRFLANLRFFTPIGDEFSFDLSAIYHYALNDPAGHYRSRFTSIDFLLRWKPLQKGEYTSVVVGGQVFAGTHEFKLDSDLDGDLDSDDAGFETKPAGFSVWAQYQWGKSIFIGVRYDLSDFLDNDDRDHSKVQPYVSYYFSEFFRLRIAYEHVTSDDPLEDDRDTLLVELNVVFGAHPPEPFWVNK